jgi:hypothetical protein
MAFGQTLLLTINPGALPQATVISGLRPEVSFPTFRSSFRPGSEYKGVRSGSHFGRHK